MKPEIHFHTKVYLTQHVLYACQLHIPTTIANDAISRFGSIRVRCKINDFEEISSALLPDGQGSLFIMINKTRWKKWGLHDGLDVTVQLNEETADYGMPMSEEMTEVFSTDPEAFDFFESLSPGKRRSLIYTISQIKSSQLRIHKSLIIASYLKESKGALDYKALGRAMKSGV